MREQHAIERGLARTMRGRIRHDDELGVRYGGDGDGLVTLTLDDAPFLREDRAGGAISQGPLATILDSVCGVAAMARLEFLEAVATVDLRLDYLRAPQPRRGIVAAAQVAEVLGEEGRGSVVVRAEVRHADDPVGAPLAAAVGRFIRRPLRDARQPVAEVPPGPLAVGDSYGALMGFRWDDDGSVVLPFRPGLVGNGSLPSLHGGAIAAHLQEAACMALARAASAPFTLATAHITYLRFGASEDVHARPEVVRAGVNTASVHVAAHQRDAGRPIAAGTFTFLSTQAPA
ncbi:MAG: hotdog domain-containing protein [Rhodospirillaceae bacterium]